MIKVDDAIVKRGKPARFVSHLVANVSLECGDRSVKRYAVHFNTQRRVGTRFVECEIRGIVAGKGVDGAVLAVRVGALNHTRGPALHDEVRAAVHTGHEWC